MNAREEQVRNLIAQDAADWFVATRAGLTDHERGRLLAWLKTSPVHVEEYLALQVLGRDMRAACEASQDLVDELLAQARREDEKPRRYSLPALLEGLRASRWQVAAASMAALALVSLGLWTLRPVTPVSSTAIASALHFQTGHGEQQTHRLADNSTLHLNTDSSVTVQYGDKERRVVLTSGEADFEVVHDHERPFRVIAGVAEVVDLGTRFDVRLQERATLVTVIEGRVAVGVSLAVQNGVRQGHASEPVQLGANQQVSVAAGMWPVAPVNVDAQRSTAWLHRQIVFERVPLEQVVTELNRYSRIPIEVNAPALRGLEISGVFSTEDITGFIAFLRSLEGVRVEETPTRILVLQ
jgi:transmembrane sensor